MANQKGKDLIVGAIAGTVLGAVTALLLAPKSGKELRSDIAEGVQQASEKTQQLVTDVTTVTSKAAKQVSAQTGEWIGKAKSVTSQVVQEVRSWKKTEEGSGATSAAAVEVVEGEAAVEPAAPAEAAEKSRQELTFVR
ncbi:YtxH domain-containing protein [Paenibacillus chartarius]|uniref:YtxH domain-containing protein n=1 Tax=Paenibacillus chartarius TaxID=747481 RepID=A0ABV6DRT0_9BACL